MLSVHASPMQPTSYWKTERMMEERLPRSWTWLGVPPVPVEEFALTVTLAAASPSGRRLPAASAKTCPARNLMRDGNAGRLVSGLARRISGTSLQMTTEDADLPENQRCSHISPLFLII